MKTRKSRHFLLIGAVIAGAVATTGLVHAQGQQRGMGDSTMMEQCPMMGGNSGSMGMMRGGGMHGGGMHGGGMHMHSQLDLDDDQRDTMRTLRRQHMEQQARHRAHLMDMREDMQALMQQEPVDVDAVRALHARMAGHHEEMLADSLHMRNEMRSHLSTEQREKMQMHQRGHRSN